MQVFMIQSEDRKVRTCVRIPTLYMKKLKSQWKYRRGCPYIVRAGIAPSGQH